MNILNNLASKALVASMVVGTAPLTTSCDEQQQRDFATVATVVGTVALGVAIGNEIEDDRRDRRRRHRRDHIEHNRNHGRRHGRGHGRGHHLSAEAKMANVNVFAAKAAIKNLSREAATTADFEKNFEMSSYASSRLVSAFRSARAGEGKALLTLGFTKNDVLAMGELRTPSRASLLKVAKTLNEKPSEVIEMVETILDVAFAEYEKELEKQRSSPFLDN